MYQWYWRAVQHHPPISLRLLLLSLTRCLLPCRHAAEPKRGLPGEPGPAPLLAHPQHPGLTAPAPGPVGTAWPFTFPPAPVSADLWPLTPLCVLQGQAGPGVGSGRGLPIHQRVSGPDRDPAGGRGWLPGLEVDPASHWLWAQLPTGPTHLLLQGLAGQR